MSGVARIASTASALHLSPSGLDLNVLLELLEESACCAEVFMMVIVTFIDRTFIENNVPS